MSILQRTTLVLGLLCALVPGQIIVNEFHAGTPDWVELRNVSPVAVDLGGWVVTTYQADLGMPAPEGAFTFAPGVMIPAGGFVVLQEYGTPGLPGTMPCSISTGFNYNWTSSRSVVVLLTSPQGTPVDYVYRQGSNGMPGAPHLPQGTGWTGSFSQTGNSCARLQDLDTDSALDWHVSFPTACAPNPGQSSVPIAMLYATTTGAGDVTINIPTTPALPGAEFATLISTTNLSPNGTGPVIGLAWDALSSFQPVAPGSPFHSWLSSQGTFSFSAPPGSLPPGFFVEGATAVLSAGGLVISPVVEITF